MPAVDPTGVCADLEQNAFHRNVSSLPLTGPALDWRAIGYMRVADEDSRATGTALPRKRAATVSKVIEREQPIARLPEVIEDRTASSGVRGTRS